MLEVTSHHWIQLMRRVVFAVSVAIFVFTYTSVIAETPINAELRERIAKAKQKASRSKDGHVIIGRVVVEEGDDPALVKSQMEILNDGFFAGATGDPFRPVGFRMHGYAPFDLELDPKKQKVTDGNVMDVGVIQMKRLKEADFVHLKGLLTLEESGDPKTAKISMSVGNGPVNTPSNGTEGRRRWAKSTNVLVNDMGLFEQGGFSPIKYYCSISAPGYVRHGFYVDFSNKEDTFLGRIKLEKPRRATLEYIVSKDEDFDVDATKKTVQSGGERWKVTPDIYGWDVEFIQKRGKLSFTYSYGPCFMADLGEGELEDFLDIDHNAATQRPRGMEVHDGHVYLMLQKHWKRNVLFKVKLQQTEE